jgi:hypothetical protein
MQQHKIGMRHYAKVPLKSVGREAWEKQDITGVWSDAGEVQAVVQRHLGNMIGELQDTVARNAMIGASDYLAEGEASLALSPNNDILLGIRIYNDGAQMIAHVSLRELLFAALSELRPHLGVDQKAQTLLSQLKFLGTQLASLGAPPKRQPHEDTAA